MPFNARPQVDHVRRKKLLIALRRLSETEAFLGVADKALVARPAIVRRAQEGYRGICAIDWPVLMTLVQSGWVELWRETDRVMVFRIAPPGRLHLKSELERRARERRLWREQAA